MKQYVSGSVTRCDMLRFVISLCLRGMGRETRRCRCDCDTDFKGYRLFQGFRRALVGTGMREGVVEVGGGGVVFLLTCVALFREKSHREPEGTVREMVRDGRVARLCYRD